MNRPINLGDMVDCAGGVTGRVGAIHDDFIYLDLEDNKPLVLVDRKCVVLVTHQDDLGEERGR